MELDQRILRGLGALLGAVALALAALVIGGIFARGGDEVATVVVPGPVATTAPLAVPTSDPTPTPTTIPAAAAAAPVAETATDVPADPQPTPTAAPTPTLIPAPTATALPAVDPGEPEQNAAPTEQGTTEVVDASGSTTLEAGVSLADEQTAVVDSAAAQAQATAENGEESGTPEPSVTTSPTVLASDLTAAPTATASQTSGDVAETPTATAAATSDPVSTDALQASAGNAAETPAQGADSGSTAEPTSTQVATTVTATPTVGATATAAPTPTPTPTSTPEASTQERDVLTAASGWMYVDSEEGLYLRLRPAGTIEQVLNHGEAVFATGQVVNIADRLWMEIDSPAQGWVALAFLSMNEPDPLPTTPAVTSGQAPTAADWAALRACESSGNYSIVSGDGLYHGAYQFLPSTWDGLARRFWPELVGVLPSAASPADQDKMALKLYELEGARPWPVCGRHLL